jgi:glutamate synthase (NADPH/NADH) small chain
MSKREIIKTKYPMPEKAPEERIKSFEEVAQGYTENLAMLEAKRCLQCKDPKCVAGCPVGVDIPSFIQLIMDGKFADAARKIKEKNALPAICGRVCPQESQCEKDCLKPGQQNVCMNSVSPWQIRLMP